MTTRVPSCPGTVPAASRWSAIADHLADAGMPGWRFDQVVDAVFRQRVDVFTRMHTLPLTLRRSLSARFGTRLLGLRAVSEQRAAQAHKVLLAATDESKVEAVHLSYRQRWSSLCISSQAGCGLSCSFCATATLGLRRNLTADEITDQVLWFRLRRRPVDRLSFMGMGEPLANPALPDAISLLTHPRLFAMSPRRLTVSTVGVVPGLERLLASHPGVTVTFSLHSPFPGERAELIPMERNHPATAVLDALADHAARTTRRVWVAYLLLAGRNDSDDHAAAVARLIRERPGLAGRVRVSVIPYNPAFGVPDRYARPSPERVRAFRDRLAAAGVPVGIRAQFGADIDAGCGQLAARGALPVVRPPA